MGAGEGCAELLGSRLVTTDAQAGRSFVSMRDLQGSRGATRQKGVGRINVSVPAVGHNVTRNSKISKVFPKG